MLAQQATIKTTPSYMPYTRYFAGSTGLFIGCERGVSWTDADGWDKVVGKQIGPVTPIAPHYLQHYVPWDWPNLFGIHLGT